MAHAHAHAAEGHVHHITPRSTLLKVFGALVFLTIFTVVSSRIDLGVLNVPLALAIALTKAALVVMFFMALKYDKKVNVLTFTVGTIFVLVFLLFTLFDVAFRGDLGNVSEATITDMLREEELLRGQEAGAQAPGGGAAAADTTAADTTAADTTGAIGTDTEAPSDTTAGGQ